MHRYGSSWGSYGVKGELEDEESPATQRSSPVPVTERARAVGRAGVYGKLLSLRLLWVCSPASASGLGAATGQQSHGLEELDAEQGQALSICHHT